MTTRFRLLGPVPYTGWAPNDILHGRFRSLQAFCQAPGGPDGS